MSEPLTTGDINDLLATIQESQQHLRAVERRLREHGDAIAIAARPTYPTGEQIAGIEEAARRIRAGETPESHHGVGVGPVGSPYIVTVHGVSGWLRVKVGAPYRLTRQGERLWDFTDEEVEAILDVVRAQGLTVDHHWRADNGLSINTTHRQGEHTDD